MTEAVAGDVVVAHLDHELRSSPAPIRRVRSVLQRLGPPGALPVKPGGAISASSCLVSAGRSASVMVEVKPT